MSHESANSDANPARLLLIDCAGSLPERLAAPLSAGLMAAPIVVGLTSGRPALDLLRGSSFDVIAAELAALDDLSERAEDQIARLARAASDAIIIVLTEDASISGALTAMRAGAHECVSSGIDPVTLVGRIGDLGQRHGKARSLARASDQRATGMGEPRPGPSIPMMHDLVLPMWRQEQRIIEEAIQRFAGNVALAAAALELSPSTIYRKRQSWAEIDGKRGAA